MIKNVTKKLGAAVLVLTLIGHPLTAYAADPYLNIGSATAHVSVQKYSNFATSTVVHEYGHVYWLCDNPNTTRASIMKYNRDRNSMTTPQSFDINNVNAKY